jgi:hypothetical protein
MAPLADWDYGYVMDLNYLNEFHRGTILIWLA